MVSFSSLDLIIIFSFFGILLLIGFLSGGKESNTADGYLLSGRKVGLLLFILTNVSTWYGGILGVGEFTYRYGILSWVTQGLPYYFFAILFALFFASKIRNSSLFTIPDKLDEIYGRKVGILSAVIIFILVSPAPYLLMAGNLLSLIFEIDIFWGLLAGILLSASYLLVGGYRADLLTDAFQFFVMFAGFIIIMIFSVSDFGGTEFLVNNLPETHLQFTGGASVVYVTVWFLIALWTFTDPGFHQRCYAAKDGRTAKFGIIISVFLWLIFDFLTNVTGLFTKAVIPDLVNPVLAFPIYAEKILGSGFKGVFYAALFATILSTLNSFLFLSATTFGRDFVFKLKRETENTNLKKYVQSGIIISSAIAVILGLLFTSVIDIWYTIGSICIPGIILLIIGAYFENFRVSGKTAFYEIIVSVAASLIWILIRPNFESTNILSEIEPMIIGLAAALILHLKYLLRKNLLKSIITEK